jgi:membrane-associated phospholipid phosphatase
VVTTTPLWTLTHNEWMDEGSWDERIMSAVADHRIGSVSHVANGMSELGQSPIVLGLAGLVAVLVATWRRWYRPALASAAALVAATVAADVLKHVFDRARPPHHQALVWITTPSFPSTHAAATSALAAAVLVSVVWGTWRRAAAAAAALGVVVVLVGACMVYLGAHWPSDVLVGWLIGGVLGGLIGWIARPGSSGSAPETGRARLGHAR